MRMQYDNGRIAIVLKRTEWDIEPVAVATVNIPEYTLERGHVLIKNWSENEGILEALVSSGLLEDTGALVPTGFCNANLCKLLKPEALI